MKKFIAAALVVMSFGFSQSSMAQVSININIGNQPAWGPVGYNYARYYYLPEANAYYDINAANFIFLQRGRWITARHLPPAYRSMNLYNTYKVVVNRNYAPYRDNRRDMASYRRYRGVYNQMIIRDSRDYRYYESRYHPRHNEWRGRDYRDGRGDRDDDRRERDRDRNDWKRGRG